MTSITQSSATRPGIAVGSFCWNASMKRRTTSAVTSLSPGSAKVKLSAWGMIGSPWFVVSHPVIWPSPDPHDLIWSPEFFAAMNEPDALSEALRAVRLTGAIFFDAELGAPWGFAAPPVGEGARSLALAAEHVVLFHLVTEGSATARVKGQDDVGLEAGDILVVAQGDAHELWNGQGAQLIDTSSLLPKILSGAIVSERGGGGGAITRFVCGYIRCERRARQLYLAGLPPLFRVNVRKDVSGEWIESSIRHLASESESNRPGRTALLAKLAEALFIEALRRYMSELPPERTGWLAAARDQAVGNALASLHRDPARAWTVAGLAKQAGLSRTVFAERFGQ